MTTDRILEDLEERVEMSLLQESLERALDSMEKKKTSEGDEEDHHHHQAATDTFSEELELVEPTTIWGTFINSLRNGGALHPQSYWHLGWLLLVSACFAFNCVVIPLRSTFPYQTSVNWKTWFVCDLTADAVYLLDLLLVKPHVIFLQDGFWVREKQETRRNYFRKWQFKMDIASLIPLDLLYLKYGTDKVLFRLPRIFKIQTFWELFDHLDSLLMSPYLVRVARTLFYMMFLVHLNACAYYAFSAREGIGSNNWVFGGHGNAYIRCFYFATKTATSVGKNPRPESEGEYLFMTVSWLMGVFVFALLIGQIRDIVATATRTKTEHRKRLDETLEHMRRLNLPEHVQRRVQNWFTFTAQHQPFDEAQILNSLPQKLKTDVAINVHIGTLNKVQLFHRCDDALLRDLVLKLRSVLYLPGDYICRKNEVGKEMYIVKTGHVEVLAPTDGTVLATLGEGCVFGEISLLALAGGNRRTADVRSKGFSNLFVLSKSDLNETLVYYPEAQKILKQKAEALMRENADRERREARRNRGSPSTTPETLTDCSSLSTSSDDSDNCQPQERVRCWNDSASPGIRRASRGSLSAGKVSVECSEGCTQIRLQQSPPIPLVLTSSPEPIKDLLSARPSLQSDIIPDDVFREDVVPSVQITDHDSDLTEVTSASATLTTAKRSSASSTDSVSSNRDRRRRRQSSSSDDSLCTSNSVSNRSNYSATTRARISTVRGRGWGRDTPHHSDDTLSDLSSISLRSPTTSLLSDTRSPFWAESVFLYAPGTAPAAAATSPSHCCVERRVSAPTPGLKPPSFLERRSGSVPNPETTSPLLVPRRRASASPTFAEADGLLKPESPLSDHIDGSTWVSSMMVPSASSSPTAGPSLSLDE